MIDACQARRSAFVGPLRPTVLLPFCAPDFLTAGIPKDTLQYTQIEVAREALKDYTYDWAKLGIVTEGEDLLLKLEFDGKPAAPLPFVYKKEIGGFVRVDAGSKGSRFQGIHLNVNFRLPLNKMIQYKDLLKMIK